MRFYRLTPHHLFELATAIVFALVGLAWLSEPAKTALRSPVGHNVGFYADAWSVLYLVALPLVAWGVFRSNAIRIAGLMLLGTGLVMNCIAALSFEQIGPRSFGYGVFAIACFLRAWLLVKLTPRR